MLVVNIVGFPYKLKLRNGQTIIVPNDNQPHEVPDEIAENKFDNVFHVLVPPKPKNYIPIMNVNVLNETNQKVSQIIEIDLSNDIKIEDNTKVDVNPVEEIKIEIDKPPLKGVKIKKAKREKLIKNNFTKN